MAAAQTAGRGPGAPAALEGARLRSDLAALGHEGTWTQLNERDLTDIEAPVLPAGFRFRTAEEAGPEAAVAAHVAAWAPSTYSAAAYEDVRRAPAYRGDLHVLVEAPDGTMAASTIMWLDEVNRTAEFEPVGTHPGYRRQGLGRAMLLHGMHLARDAGAVHMTVACLGAPGHPKARGLYYGVGFSKLSWDAPMIRAASQNGQPSTGRCSTESTASATNTSIR